MVTAGAVVFAAKAAALAFFARSSAASPSTQPEHGVSVEGDAADHCRRMTHFYFYDRYYDATTQLPQWLDYPSTAAALDDDNGRATAPERPPPSSPSSPPPPAEADTADAADADADADAAPVPSWRRLAAWLMCGLCSRAPPLRLSWQLSATKRQQAGDRGRVPRGSYISERFRTAGISILDG